MYSNMYNLSIHVFNVFLLIRCDNRKLVIPISRLDADQNATLKSYDLSKRRRSKGS